MLDRKQSIVSSSELSLFGFLVAFEMVVVGVVVVVFVVELMEVEVVVVVAALVVVDDEPICLVVGVVLLLYSCSSWESICWRQSSDLYFLRVVNRFSIVESMLYSYNKYMEMNDGDKS